MTEPSPGSGTPGNPPGSGTPPPSGGGSGPSPVVTGDWLNGLQDAGNRELVTKKGWDKQGPDAFVASYRDLEGRLGKSVVPPGEAATQEDYDRFASAVGRPPAPDGYKFSLPKELPTNFPYDDVAATEYKTWAHEAGLAPWQAQKVHDRFVAKQAQLMANAQATVQGKIDRAHQDIVGKWGSPESDGYQQNVKMAGRALRQLDLTDTLKAHGLIAPNGAITDSKMAFALATIGEGLFKEDGQFGGPGNIPANNPWKDGQENLTEQGRIQRENPELARTLITAAGKDPNKALWSDGRQPAR